jgi:hypothetical protein
VVIVVFAAGFGSGYLFGKSSGPGRFSEIQMDLGVSGIPEIMLIPDQILKRRMMLIPDRIH